MLVDCFVEVLDEPVLAAWGKDVVVLLLGMGSSLAALGASGSSGANKSATLRGGAIASFEVG